SKRDWSSDVCSSDLGMICFPAFGIECGLCTIRLSICLNFSLEKVRCKPWLASTMMEGVLAILKLLLLIMNIKLNHRMQITAKEGATETGMEATGHIQHVNGLGYFFDLYYLSSHLYFCTRATYPKQVQQ